jgi:hypothetical protein
MSKLVLVIVLLIGLIALNHALSNEEEWSNYKVSCGCRIFNVRIVCRFKELLIILLIRSKKLFIINHEKFKFC